MVYGTGMLPDSVIIIQQGLYYAMLDNYDLTYLSPYTLYLVLSTALAQKAKAKLRALIQT